MNRRGAKLRGVRIGVAHHLGWAVVVTAGDDHRVLDRRRVELVDEGLPNAPIHHVGGPWELHRDGPSPTDAELAALVAEVRASVVRGTAAALDEVVAVIGAPVASISVATWPDDFPTDLATLRRVPYESRADPVMYRRVLAEVAGERGWPIHRYDPKRAEAEASAVLGDRAHEVLHGPRGVLGPPWGKDHRIALAATVLASGDAPA